jgi:two-component sensor histidine kinase
METLLLALLPRRRYPVLLRYGTTAVIVGFAFLLRLILDEPLHGYPFLLFIPAVFLSALLFDRGSGFFATALSTALAASFFMEPGGTLGDRAGQLVPLAVFVVVCMSITVLTEALRLTLEKVTIAERSKDLLLREFAHRTKNDLTMIASVLHLQARAVVNPEARAAFDAAISRVQVIAQAQEQLRLVDGHGEVDMRAYLSKLCARLGDLLRDVRPVAVRVEAEDVKLSSADAVPIGLITNELVTNAFKYAFPGNRGGAVDVRFRKMGESRIELEVRDDGVGCPDQAPEGLGSRLVRLLVEQMRGTLHRESTNPGCRVVAELEIGGRS